MEDEIHMKIVLYTVSVLMIIAWALCYFVYSFGGTIHILLLLAVLLGMMGISKKQ